MLHPFQFFFRNKLFIVYVYPVSVYRNELVSEQENKFAGYALSTLTSVAEIELRLSLLCKAIFLGVSSLSLWNF